MATGTRTSAAIRAEIDNYATRNYVSSPATNVTSYYTDAGRARIGGPFTAASENAPANALGVEVITTMQPPLFFIPIVGVSSLQVRRAPDVRPGDLRNAVDRRDLPLQVTRAASRGGPAAGPGGAHARSISHHPGEAVPELGPPPSR